MCVVCRTTSIAVIGICTGCLRGTLLFQKTVTIILQIHCNKTWYSLFANDSAHILPLSLSTLTPIACTQIYNKSAINQNANMLDLKYIQLPIPGIRLSS